MTGLSLVTKGMICRTQLILSGPKLDLKQGVNELALKETEKKLELKQSVNELNLVATVKKLGICSEQMKINIDVKE